MPSGMRGWAPCRFGSGRRSLIGRNTNIRIIVRFVWVAAAIIGDFHIGDRFNRHVDADRISLLLVKFVPDVDHSRQVWRRASTIGSDSGTCAGARSVRCNQRKKFIFDFTTRTVTGLVGVKIYVTEDDVTVSRVGCVGVTIH